MLTGQENVEDIQHEHHNTKEEEREREEKKLKTKAQLFSHDENHM